MEVKEAVAVAKRHVLDVMSEEAIDDVTLEEVWYERRKKYWRVTLGIRRMAKRESAAGRLGLALLPDYKTVTLSDDDGRIVSLKNCVFQGSEE